MNRKIAVIDNELKQSLDVFNTGKFLGLGEYDNDENLNNYVLLPNLINKPFCDTSASGVIDLTKIPSDLVSDIDKPLVKPSIDTNDSVTSNNLSGSEASGKTNTFGTNCDYFTVCNKKIPFAIADVHANECLNKKQQPNIYSEDSARREEEIYYESKKDKDVEIFTDDDDVTIDYKILISVDLKHCNKAKRKALFMSISTMNLRIFRSFLIINRITKI